MQERHQNKGENRQAKDAKNIAIPKHQVGKRREPDKTPDSAEREQRWQKRFAIFSLVFDAVVAISAVVGGYLIWEQMGLTRESNRLTQESNRLTRQAMVESKRQFDLQRKDDASAAEKEEARVASERKESERRAAYSLEEARRLNRLTEQQTEISATNMLTSSIQVATAHEVFTEEYEVRISAVAEEADISRPLPA